MARWLAFAIVVAFVPAVAYARLDPESNKPYDLRIILQIAPTRVLTPAFRERLQRGLHDNLQAALGRLGNVRVIDAATLAANAAAPDRLHKLYQQVQVQGLNEGLDNWKEISETKTHFVFVDV